MKQSAIICEFNSLHNGHIRLIQHASAQGCLVVCIMSGNFTQRGMPAVADKYTRARHAILAGASIVVELPTISATSSAEEFARGAVDIANRLAVDNLCFGSELGNTDQLIECADALLTDNNTTAVKQLLATGYSYPKALATAYPQYSAILDQPNNVLALEYIKQLKLTNSNITPITLARNNDYNSNQLEGKYASATAIRDNLDCKQVLDYLPQYVLDDISLVAENNYKQYLPLHLSTLTAQHLSQIYGAVEGLHNRIHSCANTSSYDKLVETVKSKRYTQLRIQRLLLHCALGVTEDIVSQYRNSTTPIRVLAIADQHAPQLLSHYASINAQLNTCDDTLDSIDRRADRLYNALTDNIMPYSMTKI